MTKKIFARAMAFVLCIMMVLGSAGFAVQAEESGVTNPFTDVKETDYYYEAVLWALEEGITTGVSATSFSGSENCTKAQVITFLWRAAGKPEAESKEVGFTDVSQGAYYYDALCWAVENGVVDGDTTEFVPNEPLTRGKALMYIHERLGSPAPTIENPFSDVTESDEYYNAAIWAYEVGITNGTSTTVVTLNAEAIVSRAQVVTFLWRARDLEPETDEPEDDNDTSLVNAADYGLSPENDGYENSTILQNLVNDLSEAGGGTIYIPEGEYVFCEIGTQAIGSHCIKMASNVSILGAGESTVFRPTGESSGGLDMFYFNNLLDKQEPLYLENCNFEGFVIDGADTSCKKYTSAGKGFMFNLFKNCNWKNVTVKNTDATGFGVDCPIGGSIENCVAINCGKAATTSNGGASGFGIGFGYSEDEYFTISNCKSYNNKKFGFFFEHQGRFSSKKYAAECAEGFVISDCEASGNYYNFGGLLTMDTTYQNCISENAVQHGFFFENSKNCKVINCTSKNETDTSFVILQSGSDGGTQDVTNIIYEQCTSYNSPYGVKVRSMGSTSVMKDNIVKECQFYSNETNTVLTSGTMAGLTLSGNVSDRNNNSLETVIENFVNVDNSWNVE